MTGTYFSRIFIVLRHANHVIPGFICAIQCHIFHAFSRRWCGKNKKGEYKNNIFGQVFTNVAAIDPCIAAFSTALSTNTIPTNKWTIFPSLYLPLSLLLLLLLVTWLGFDDVVVHFSFVLFSFLFLFIFMIIAVIQFSAACAIRFHLFAIEIFMRCVTFAHIV